MSIKTGIVLFVTAFCCVEAWMSKMPSARTLRCRRSIVLRAAPPQIEHDGDQPADEMGRRGILWAQSQIEYDDGQHIDVARRGILWSCVLTVATCSSPAFALVKGNAPPPKQKPMSEKPKCRNVEECQEEAERKQAQDDASVPKGPPPKTTKAGTRYIDMEDGNASAGTVKEGDQVNMYYKVLKLGKRSYDGLSGEATVVFSRGYGLEDDEKAPGGKSFMTTIGSAQNIGALNDAIIGMNVGGIRRFTILPQQGWERPTAQCDGGPGGRGSGGELKTDYVVVPTATMVATEECFDKTKQPFPSTYAQERRMAQRFDQSLIMEVQVIGIK